MKKSSIIILLAIVIFSSCRKDDKSVFDKSPDDRLNEKLSAYQVQLSGAQNGWKAFIKVDSGRGSIFSFYFKFKEANRVVMLSGFDSLSSVTPKESSYRLKALQQPSLIFDTYSYLHVLADPDETVNGGVRGGGLFSDFEFYFDSSSTDTIRLVGRINGSKLMLVRATPAEENAYNNGGLASGLYINKILTYFKRLTVGNQLIDVRVNRANNTIIFMWLDGSGNAQTFSSSFYLVLGGINLVNPLVIGNLTIKSLDNILWDQASQTISLSTNGAAATITGIVVPLKIDVDAPRRWWDYAINNGNTYWISADGFHVDGVDDAFGIKSLATAGNTYYYLIYWPEYDVGNDLFAPVFLDPTQTSLTLLYGTAPSTPTFTADGRAIFVRLGDYGTYPRTGPATLSKTLLFNSSGYYFVQTSPTSYDMVSAANGRSWITWEF